MATNTTIFLSLKYIVSSRSKTPLLVPLLKLLTHTTPILKSLHWLKINERIQYKILYRTFKLLYTTQPPYLCDLISLQTPRNTRSSSVVTRARPPTPTSLKITSRSFHYASPYLWNQLPHSLRQPRLDLPLPDSSLLHLASVIITTIIIYHPIILPFQTQNFPISQILPSIDIWHDFTDTRTALRLFSLFQCLFYFSVIVFPSVLVFLS